MNTNNRVYDKSTGQWVSEAKEITVHEQAPSTRVRINVSRSVKGVFTFDCTIEGTNIPQEEVLRRSDALRKQLEERYPHESLS